MADSDVTKWRHQGNRYGVGASVDGKKIRIMGLAAAAGGPLSTVAAGPPLVLSREHALELAAWIVAVAFPQEGEFERILDYIRGKPVA